MEDMFANSNYQYEEVCKVCDTTLLDTTCRCTNQVCATCNCLLLCDPYDGVLYHHNSLGTTYCPKERYEIYDEEMWRPHYA